MTAGATVAIETGSALEQPTGVGTYINQLAAGLIRAWPERVRLIGVQPSGPLAGLYRPRCDAWIRGRYMPWLQYRAEQHADQVGAELTHYTNALAPLLARRPFVLTIHDLSLLRYPHYHPVRRLATVPLMAAAARRAQLVIVPSAATGAELVRLLRVRSDRIRVIPHAPVVREGADERTSDRLLEQLGIEGGNYILSVATLEPRKNLRRLVAAFEALASEDPSLRLVLLGGAGWHSKRFRRTLQQNSLGGRIITTGYVGEGEKTLLMRRCLAFVYVSLYEGYGLPVVEAMAAGAPVVTSDRSSMPEAAGGAAVLVDPTSSDAIARGIREALRRRAELVDRGYERVGALSWDKVAQETLDVYDAALQNSGL